MYLLTNLVVRTFQGKKRLSAPKHAAIITDDDITDVASAESFDSDSDNPMTMKDAEIITACFPLIYGLPHMQSLFLCVLLVYQGVVRMSCDFKSRSV